MPLKSLVIEGGPAAFSPQHTSGAASDSYQLFRLALSWISRTRLLTTGLAARP